MEINFTFRRVNEGKENDKGSGGGADWMAGCRGKEVGVGVGRGGRGEQDVLHVYGKRSHDKIGAVMSSVKLGWTPDFSFPFLHPHVKKYVCLVD